MSPAAVHYTLDQQRASRALNAVKGVVDLGSGNPAKRHQRKYVSYAKDLPVMILQCGIGQTLAFLDSKRKGKLGNAEADIISHISDWVGQSRGVTLTKPANAPVNWLLAELLSVDPRVWRRATDEAVAYTTWLKRFAEAMIGDIDPGVDDGLDTEDGAGGASVG